MHNPINYQLGTSRHQYPADNVYAIKPTNTFQGQVTKTEIGYGTSMRIIDNAVAVESVDEKTRAAALHQFSTYQQKAHLDEKRLTSHYYQGIAATVLGMGISIGSVVLLPFPSLICAAAAGATLSGLGVWTSVTNNGLIKDVGEEIHSIEKQMKEWQDPLEMAIAQRKEAGVQGFQYVYKNQLKGKVVHQEEVEELWLRDFSKLIGRNQNIKKICEDNLLGDECIAFAWNRAELPDFEVSGRYFSDEALDALCKQFRACRTSFLNFELAVQQEFAALDNQKKQMKNEIETLRSQWLHPAECLHAQAKQEAEYLYETALRPLIHEKNAAIEKIRHDYHYVLRNAYDAEEIAYKRQLEQLCEQEIQYIRHHYNTHPAVISIEQAYANDRSRCDFLLKQSQLVVHAFFDTRLEALRKAYNETKTRIEEQQKAGHQNFQILMDSILSHIGEESVQNPLLPASVQRNWTLPLSLKEEPNWTDVYGKLPPFQADFKNNLSELEWNLFWGHQGIGRFSSCPSTSWSQLSRDRMAFPFRQHWFNLHTMPVIRHNSGMFMRPVNVPVFAKSVNLPHVVPGSRTPAPTSYASTPHRDAVHVSPGTRTPVAPTSPSTSFAGTTNRVVPGTRPPAPVNTGYASTANRVVPGVRTPAPTSYASTPNRAVPAPTNTAFAGAANRVVPGSRANGFAQGIRR
jgi:hypothetical protein